MNFSDYNVSIFTGIIVLGLITSTLVILIGCYCYFCRKSKWRQKHNQYQGIYNAFNKYDVGKNTPVFKIKITVNENLFNFEMTRIIDNVRGYGEIKFDQLSYNGGNGHYTLDWSNEQNWSERIGFGFIECQLFDKNNILVHFTWFNENRTAVYDPYIWERQTPKISNE